MNETVEHYSIPSWFTGLPEVCHSSEIKSSKFILPDCDVILVSRLNPEVHKVWRVGPKNGTVTRLASTEWAVVLPLEDSDLDYLNCALETREFKFQMNSYVTGTTGSHKRVRTSDFLKLTIPNNSISAKKNIGKTHELFRRHIAIQSLIEPLVFEILSTLFCSWFIEFEPVIKKTEGSIPFGLDADSSSLFPNTFKDSEIGPIPVNWSLKRYSDCIYLKYGKALKSEDRVDGNIPTIGSNGIIGYHDELLVNGPGIVIGRKGNPGTVMWINEDFFPIDTTFFVVPKSPHIPLEFLYFSLKFANLPWFAADSAVPGVNREVILRQNIVIPPKELIEKFTTIVKSSLALIRNSKHTINSLNMASEILFPRLISNKLKNN